MALQGALCDAQAALAREADAHAQTTGALALERATHADTRGRLAYRESASGWLRFPFAAVRQRVAARR